MKKNLMMNSKMKSFFGASGLALFLSIQVHAQQETEPAKRLTDSLQSQLQLTEAQYPKVLAINEHFISELQELKGQGGGKLSKLRKVKAVGDERNTALKEVLTDEQYKAWEARQAENKAKMKERFRNNR